MDEETSNINTEIQDSIANQLKIERNNIIRRVVKEEYLVIVLG